MAIIKQVQPQPVDLKAIKVSAKIDFITLATEGYLDLPALDGSVRWAKSARYERFSVHDPSPGDVRAINERHGDLGLVEIEVAVDMRASKGAEGGAQLLEAVLTQLFAKQLHPRGAPGMQSASRCFYRHLETGYLVRPFNMGLPLATDQQLHGWRDDDAQVKCYLKRRDLGKSLAEVDHVARVEVRLARCGLEQHGLSTMLDLVGFDFRKNLMPYFRHVSGTARPSRAKRGAMPGPLVGVMKQKLNEFDRDHWAQVGAGAFLPGGKCADRPVRFIRNSLVNGRIGQALMRLGRRFSADKFVRTGSGEGTESPCQATSYAVTSESSITY